MDDRSSRVLYRGGMERDWDHGDHDEDHGNPDREEDRTERLLEELVHQGREMATDIDTIEAHLQPMVDVDTGVLALLNTLGDDLRAGVNDPQAVAAVIANIDANKQRMAEAIIANTPVAPDPTPPVDPPVDVPPVENPTVATL